MKKICTAFVALNCLMTGMSNGQTSVKSRVDPHSFQYGFSLKATIEFAFHAQVKPRGWFRISGNAGIGSSFITSSFHPAFNLEMQLYNGGLGSDNQKNFFNNTTLDVIAAITLTGGWNNQTKIAKYPAFPETNVPLYYFGDFVLPALRNPYQYSLSLGTNFIFSTDRNKTSQRVGFFNAHAKFLQVSYFNDGGVPMYQTNLGDRRDRYYTTGLVISAHAKRNTAVDLVELSYYKFTGYTRNAFELSNKMYLGYMNYRKTEQKYYNKSLLTLTLANTTRSGGVSIKAYNHLWLDFQHKVHWGLFNSYHLVPYPSFISISGNYYGSQTNLGIQ